VRVAALVGLISLASFALLVEMPVRTSVTWTQDNTLPTPLAHHVQLNCGDALGSGPPIFVQGGFAKLQPCRGPLRSRRLELLGVAACAVLVFSVGLLLHRSRRSRPTREAVPL
jgi:hypothetical protein